MRLKNLIKKIMFNCSADAIGLILVASLSYGAYQMMQRPNNEVLNINCINCSKLEDRATNSKVIKNSPHTIAYDLKGDGKPDFIKKTHVSFSPIFPGLITTIIYSTPTSEEINLYNK